ncbi:MAG: HIT family protein [Clostridia bacterium]|nr:HIT family protein [Clostridia bacterium]
MEDCIFCKIIKGDIPSFKIYEDEYTYAFLDIAKDVDGHTLVVPKKHVVNVLDSDEETLHHVLDTVKKISNHYTDDLGYDGVDIMNASGEAAQQSVFHMHFHIIPRKKNDGVDAWPKFEGAKEELEVMHEKLKLM